MQRSSVMYVNLCLVSHIELIANSSASWFVEIPTTATTSKIKQSTVI